MRKKPFEELYPVDFITEGHDQVRGWFFSLLRAGVIGFGESPYKRVVIHGFVLDEKGREMHKSLGNYVPPTDVIDRYGRDVLRYGLLQYTIWEDLKFSWKAMELAYRELNILWNTYLFASLYMNLDKFNYFDNPLEKYFDNLYPEDKWILSRINSLIRQVDGFLDKCISHEAIRGIREFFLEDLSRRYIRLIRWRTWLEGDSPDKFSVYSVLYYVLFRLLLLLSPFTPFLTEKIYQDMFRKAIPDAFESVHMYSFPEYDASLIDKDLEAKMKYIDKVLEAGGAARMAAKIKFRVPLKTIYILTTSSDLENAIKVFQDVIKNQLNVKNVALGKVDDLNRFLEKYVEPLLSKLGPKYKGEAPKLAKYISDHSIELARELDLKKSIIVSVDGNEYVIDSEMVELKKRPKENFVVKEFEYGYIVLDKTISEDEVAEGLARDIVRRIQFMRKELDLHIDAYIKAYVKVPDERAFEYILKFKDYISNETRAKELIITLEDFDVEGLYVKEWDISGDRYLIGISEV